MFPSCGIEGILHHDFILPENRLLHETCPSCENFIHGIWE
jgi:hypothetical protein